MKQFLTVRQIKNNKNCVKLHLKEPNEASLDPQELPSIFGIIEQELEEFDKNKAFEALFSTFSPLKKSLLKFNLMIPKQDAMQYLIQWQRYRKYWWSCISSTPSLFSTNEFRHENDSAKVDIVAQLPSGQHPVENLCYKADAKERTNQITCTMCLEDALFILLLDGLHSSGEEDSLRLHRKIAPFKISFAVDSESETANRAFLCRLATLLYHKLELKKISAWLPDFSLPLDLQIKENLKRGVVYTGILDDETLKFGIFKLMNSSTKLTEQVHVADFCKNASLIFNNKI
ncbi:hypothetical protein PYW08_016486 [Mythimna loreyi]|uniref:Uncharacterized protein n=1 Tax=Mythimna loreyi TaxID=667449 RepID=A0ACC2R1F5_9NEOP|nr:hypothetical protein PYW08_016486 [Mythimna loreyi]